MDITLDLETLSTSPRAALLQLSAVAWDRTCIYTPFLEEPGNFNLIIDPIDCMKRGCDISSQTLAFWQKRPKEFARYLDAPDKRTLTDALDEFIEWVSCLHRIYPEQPIHLWTQGTDFDLGILRNHLTAIDLTDGTHRLDQLNALIPYYNARDARTYILTTARHVMTGTTVSDASPSDNHAQTYVPLSAPEPEDTRTIYRLLPEFPEADTTRVHDALYDARRTTWNVWSIMHA